MRRALALAVCLVVAGCTGDEGAPTPSSAMTAPSPMTPSPSTAGGASVPVATVTEVGGWRIAIDAPSGGSTVGPPVTLCYEITGTTREAIVALDVGVSSPGAQEPVLSDLLDAHVGRGGVTVDLGAVDEGTYDLDVTLIVDGERRAERVVRIRVTVEEGAPRVVC